MVFRFLGRKSRPSKGNRMQEPGVEEAWLEPRFSIPRDSSGDSSSSAEENSASFEENEPDSPSEERGARPEPLSPEAPPQHALPARASRMSFHAPAVLDNNLGEGPTFSAGVNDRVWRRRAKPVNYYGEVSKLIRGVLTPTRPKREAEGFVGRRHELAAAIRAIEEERAHLLITGEPGIGKSSLANAIASQAEAAGYFVARLSCTSDLTRERFVAAVFEELEDRVASAPAGAVLLQQLGIEQLSDLLSEGSHDVMHLLRAFARLESVQMLAVVDDFDMVADPEVRRFVNEFMKGLSDRAATLLMVIVASESSDPEATPMLPAWLRRVRIQPLSGSEAEAALLAAEREIGLQFEEEARRAIRLASQGHPRVLQWLAFLATRRAVERFSSGISFEDLQAVVPDSIERIGGDLAQQYDAVRRGEEPTLMENALLLAALSPQRDGLVDPEVLSRLAPWVLPKGLTPLALHAALSRLCDQGRSSILVKVNSYRGTLYRFADPMMRSLVLLKNFDRLDFSHLADGLQEQVSSEISWSGNGDAQHLLSRPG